jgi:alpha-mannosidase
MQKHTEITRRRVQQFVRHLREKLYRDRLPVSLATFAAPDRISYAEAARAKYRPCRIGQPFGPTWSTHWVKLGYRIPAAWRGEEVHLLWDSLSEACVWERGVPTQGLTGTGGPGWLGSGPTRSQYRLTRSARGGENGTLHLEVACNHLFGTEEFPGASLKQAEIAVFDRDAWTLMWDFVIVADMAQHLPAETPRGGQALWAANEMVNLCHLDDPATWPKARAVARRFLAARNGDGQHNLSAIGHAHIDTAWLWPLAETVRKCYRTFSTAVRYMDDYPEYKFVCSQAQQLAWMKERQPRLYAKIKAAVRRGQFVPAGGSWVEPDCNIPSGESLVRQFLLGQRFFRAEFGEYCQEFWNPDVFGYCGQLPQIVRGAGIEFFLTQKLSWNQFNKPHSHTFWWEGLDGTRVFTHFPPADTYNATGNVRELLFNVRNYKDLERSNESYYLFGHGDGGGGPTPEMLEQLRRVGDVDGLPRVRQRSPREFFARCKADAKPLTVRTGELYFELHRGTYTTQARNKRDNRRAELLLRDVEFLGAVARPAKYPGRELERLWKLVCLNQFHDIIPGSSIGEVYRDSGAHYDEILAAAGGLRDRAVAALAGPTGRRVLVVNTLSAPRTEVVTIGGKPAVVAAPPMGYAVQAPALKTDGPVTVAESPGRIVLENAFVRATFRRDGHLVSLFDKRAQREVIEPGQRANRFVLFDDRPLAHEAWDVEVYHLEKRRDVPGGRNLCVVERGPLRAGFTVEFAIGAQSRLTQRVTLDALSARLDFDCEVEWQERRKFLKVEFPTTLRADHATYETQYGHVQRPTHFNTPYDLAQFEVCAHRWGDLAEHGFGLALLNDSKYGYATHDGTMRLSLLRSPKHPDPDADMGRHRFRYALLPHAGDFRETGVIAAAHAFNSPLLVRATNAAPAERSFFTVSKPNAVVDAVKKAEDSDATIVRLYEAFGSHCIVRLSSTLPFRTAARCNLLEEDDEPLGWSARGTTLKLRPFQIVTLKLRR